MHDISVKRSVPPQPLKTAVLFLPFIRLDTTKRVFEAIRLARPIRLYIAADGPRESKPGEDEKVKVVRDYVMNHIDWECDVKTLFCEKNLGCKYGLSDSISWFFKNEEMGIILEDDCLPHPSFFRFCDELLEKYRLDERIGIISGDNFQFGKRRTKDSYYFSQYVHIWGWASWRRTWQKYDVEMELWPSVKDGEWLFDILKNKKQIKYWQDILEAVYNNKIDTWDYQLNFSCWINSRLNIMPNINLISNIGFGADAGRTTQKNKFSEIQAHEMRFPLSHPPLIIRNALADGMTARIQFSKLSIIARIANKIRRMIP